HSEERSISEGAAASAEGAEDPSTTTNSVTSAGSTVISLACTAAVGQGEVVGATALASGTSSSWSWRAASSAEGSSIENSGTALSGWCGAGTRSWIGAFSAAASGAAI